MNTGWIKLHRKSKENDIMTDANAWLLFSWILLSVDGSGKWKTGRFVLANILRLNSSTVYKILKRLEKKYKVVTLSSNNKFTIIQVQNWEKYQLLVTQSGNNKVTTKEQQSNNKVTHIQEYKNIRIKNKEILSIDNTGFGNPDINEVSKYFLEKLKIPKEDCTQRQSRQYWSTLLKESGRGIDGVKDLIDLASSDDFYRNNITSSMDLYYKRIKLMARKRSNAPQVSIMGEKGESYEALETDYRNKGILLN